MNAPALREWLAVLGERKLCLPAFDIAGGQSDFLLGIVSACEAARCPALLLVYAMTEPYVDLRTCADLVASVAARSSVPVFLCLDHGRDEQTVAQALDAGFPAVMFDASARPLDENIRRTKAMAELAHARGALIEGEVGRIGARFGDERCEAGITDPGQAERFVRETGVDVLAPAVGNAHGFYAERPRLELDLIAEIARRTGVPVSLHGGTGIPLADVRQAAERGICKMNVATGLHKRFGEAMKDAALAAAAEERFRWRGVLRAGRSAVQVAAGQYLEALGVGGLV